MSADGEHHIDGEIAIAPRPDAARASLFGEFELTGPTGIPIMLANRRARALLAILSLEPDRPMAREKVTKLLWPGRFEAQARASLRQCLLELGKSLEPIGCPVLIITRERVGLLAATMQTDLGDLERALASGHYEAAIKILSTIGSKPLLDQLSFGDALGEWLVERRDQIARRIQASVKHALAELDKDGDQKMRSRLLDVWTARDPSAWRIAVADTVSGKTRIGVLPFQALGSLESADYFADGIVDELITTLGQIPQLLVTGRTSSFHFRNTDLPLTGIADALRVSHLIEGSIQRQGDTVRINVRLIDGATGFESWAHRYDGTIDNIFLLQESVAQAVAHALGSALNLEMHAPLVRDLTQSKAAYDLYLQGRALSARLFGDGVLEIAIKLLEDAVSLDPQFAEAWVALAEAHQLVAVYTPCTDRSAASARMAECARNAIAIAPDLGYAHSLLGVHRWTKNDIVGALDLAYKGYHLEPNNPAVAMRLGSFLLYCGRTAEAMKYIEAAIDQDPVDGRKFNLRSVGNLNLGNIDAAREAGQRMVDLGFPAMWLAVATAAAGEHELAMTQYQQTRLLLNKVIFPPAGSEPMSPDVMDAYWQFAAKGVCSGKEDDRAAYCQLLDMLHATLLDPADATIVLPAIFMGYADMVFKAVSHHITPANTLCLSSLWADVEPIRRIRQHPEFIPFAQRIGMTAAWDKYGWPDLLPLPNNRLDNPATLPVETN